ncbi:MAG: DUF1579 family protein [Candidatus Zixiibacteriota bacterium]
MKIALGFAILIIFLFSTVLPAQEKISPEKQKEMIDQSMALATPGPEHQILEKMSGDWNLEIKFWTEPGGDAVLSNGTCQIKPILGGRFYESKSESGVGLSAMETLNIMGFDRRYKKYTYIGFDNFGTYFVTAEGTYDEIENRFKLQGTDYDPILNNTQVYDMITTFIDDNKFVWELYYTNPELTKGADKFKMIEVTYTRQTKE